MKTHEITKDHSETLLIVDDSPDNLTVMKKVLEKALPAATVLTCQHSEKAQSLLRDSAVSLAVLDVQMPKIDGLELCKRIKADPETPFVSVILITSHDSDPKMKAKGLALGADDFITRPMDNAELCARVKVALRVRREEAILRDTAGQAEEALVLEKDRAAEYLDLVEVMMVAIDATGVVTMINRKGCEVLGFDESEIVEKNWFEHFVPERVVKELKSISSDLLQTGSDGGGSFETPILTKNGEERLIAWHNVPVRNASGEIVGHLSSGEDITDRKAAEKELSDSENRYKALHNATFGGIAIHEKGLILDCNRGLSELSGYSVKELIGMDGLLLIAESARDMVMDHILAGYEKPYEAVGVRKNGEEYPVRLEGRNVPCEGRDARVVEFRDITEQKALEEQFRQAQKMESIGQLVGGVAHDFNNLLQIINGYADIARAQLTPAHDASASIEEISKAGEHAKELVQQLLTYSRQQVIDPVDLDLNKEIKKAQKMLRHLIGEHIQVGFVAGEEVGTVFADKGQMHQVLMNLCVNARDAMPDGGTLTVQTENIALGPDDLK